MEFHKLSNDNIEQKRLEYHKRLTELLTSQDWINISMNDSLDCKILFVPDKVAVVYCKSQISCSGKKLFDYLVHNLPNTYSEWDDIMYYAGTIHEYDLNNNNITARISNIISYGNPVWDREDVFLQICEEKDDTYYELCSNIDIINTPLNISGKAKRPNKLIHSYMHFAAKKIIETDSGCEFITIWHYDPVGLISKLLPKKMLAKIILKNLVYEYEKIQNIFSNKIINKHSESSSWLNRTTNISETRILFLKKVFCIFVSIPIINYGIKYLLPLTESTNYILTSIFIYNIFWSCVLFIGCLIKPKLMVKINSVPWAFYPSLNINIAYQAVLYIAFHEKDINLFTHFTILSDSIFWFILLINIHPSAFPIFATILLTQAYLIYAKFNATNLVIALLIAWICSISIAYTIGNYIGWDVAQQLSMIFLIISPLMRALTHIVELLPPGVSSILYINNKQKYDEFKISKIEDLSIDKKLWLIMCLLQGYIAEFISSLPCRLFTVHVFYIADKIGINMPTIGTWQKIEEQGEAIRKTGWSASPITNWMFIWLNENM